MHEAKLSGIRVVQTTFGYTYKIQMLQVCQLRSIHCLKAMGLFRCCLFLYDKHNRVCFQATTLSISISVDMTQSHGKAIELSISSRVDTPQ